MTTSTAEIILNLLINHENEWVSGQELAASLNLSRAAIWKAIAKLTADGFTIESQRGPGKGYRYIPDEKMSAAGFTLAGADHAIIPVMLGDAVVAQKFARELQKEGIYVTGFFFPVVPKGQARIRTQMSAAHSPEQIERAVEAFTRIGKQLGVIA